MSAGDRSYRLLVGCALVAGSVLILPLAFTLFPATMQRALHRVEPFVAFCAGVIHQLQLDLPPLGVAVLAFAAFALGSAGVRTSQLVARTERIRRTYRLGAPPSRLRRAAERAGVERDVRYIDDARPIAHCVGMTRPVIVISEGALRRLRDEELEAVLWHEAHHLRRRDPLRVLIARALVWLFVGLPLMDWLARRFEIAKELDADRAAMRALGDAAPVAGALFAMGPQGSTRELAIGAWSLTSVRIDQLSGDPSAVLAPPPGRASLLLTMLSLVLALALALGQGVRAHALPLPSTLHDDPLTETHCPLPADGILL